jgi:hypothetical protein
MPWHRRIGNWGLNVVTFFLFGLWTTDSQSGLRGFNRTALTSIDPRLDRFEVCSEMIKQIHDRRLRYAEVPIRSIYTAYSMEKGQRSLNAFNILARLVGHVLLGE